MKIALVLAITMSFGCATVPRAYVDTDRRFKTVLVAGHVDEVQAQIKRQYRDCVTVGATANGSNLNVTLFCEVVD